MSKTIFSLGIVFVMGIFILFSCRKDPVIEDVNPSANCYCCQQIISPNTIQFGNLNGMNILYPDTLITTGTYPGSNSSYYQLDIDQDGSYDLKFSKEVSGSYTSGPSPTTKIETLNNNTWIAVSGIPDTLYYFETDTYYSINPVIQTHYSNTSCIAHSSTDSVFSTSYYVQHFQFSDFINLANNWKSEIKTIEHANVNSPYGDDDTNPDTTIHYNLYHNNDCNDLPYNISTYIGIKKYYCGGQKLGWIKLTLGQYELRIEEIAIQK